jgi:hypothetical protein
MDGNGSETLVLLNSTAGVTLISDGSPLTRLNYFDGKFLRAEDLQAEQTYLRRLVQMSNQAHGAGVVHGFEVTRASGDKLRLAPGLAIDNEGRVLFLSETAEVSLAALLAQAAQAAASGGDAAFGACAPLAAEPGTAPIADAAIYVIGISQAEALCGHEDVYGQACQQACITESARPFRVEGVALQARPLVLTSPLPTSTAVVLDAIHLRSRVASAYFADERGRPASLISQAGLASSIWCAGAAASAGGFVPLAVLARSGQAVRFLDLWTARRERGDPHPMRYWRNRLAMRPWDVFLAQVLQFQCQLRDSWSELGEAPDPCADERALIAEASEVMGELESYYKASSEMLVKKVLGGETQDKPGGGASRFGALLGKLRKAKETFTLTPTSRVLISKGIVELPSGGYLPVTPASNLTVNEQVRRLMGEGVDLRFCVVRPDYVAHALESVQHMDRISLLKGLDDPSAKEAVDILVPDGQIGQDAASKGAAWEGRVRRVPSTDDTDGDDTYVEVGSEKITSYKAAAKRPADAIGKLEGAYQREVLGGAARSETKPGGELSFFFAGLAELPDQGDATERLREWAKETKQPAEATLWRSIHDVAEPKAEAVSEASGAKTEKVAKKEAASAPADDAMAIGAGYARLKDEAIRYRADLGARMAKKAGVRGQRQFGGLDDEPVDHAAVWVGLRLDRDPFMAPEQARVAGSLDLTYLMPRKGGSRLIDLALTGRLVIEGSRVTGSRQIVQGTFLGDAVVRLDFADISEASRVIKVNVPVILTRRADSEGVRVTLNADLQSVGSDDRGLLGVLDLEAQVDVMSDGREVELSLVVRGEIEKSAREREPLKLMGALRRNDAAIKPGNALRAASETAIEVLGARDGGSGFVADAQDDLFGRPALGGDPLVVRATRDWVMFHRRRDKRCGQDGPGAETGVRRYQLYHVRAKTEAQARTASAAVMAADAAAITKAGFKPIAAIEFGIGRSSLVTPEADVIADWQAADPGEKLVFGAIGSLGPAQAEGEALARARLSSLELTVSRDGLPPMADNHVLPLLPALGLNGMDGALFLITQAQKSMCHTIYVTHDDNFPNLVIHNGLAGEIEKEGLSPVLEVVFENGATPTAASLQKLREYWAKNDYGEPPFAAVYQAGPNDAARRTLLLAQAQAIIEGLDGEPTDATLAISPDVTELTECDAITVVYANQRYQKIALVAALPNATTGALTLEVQDFLFDGSALTDEGGFVTSVQSVLQRPYQRAEPFAPSTDRLAKAMTLALPIGNRITSISSGVVVLPPADVIQTDIRNLIQNAGFDTDGYDLLVIFR